MCKEAIKEIKAQAISAQNNLSFVNIFSKTHKKVMNASERYTIVVARNISCGEGHITLPNVRQYVSAKITPNTDIIDKIYKIEHTFCLLISINFS